MKKLILGICLCLLGPVLLITLPAVGEPSPYPFDLSGSWDFQMKCAGLEGPDLAMPGAQLKPQMNGKLLIKSDNNSKAVEVLMFSEEEWALFASNPASGTPKAAWCGWRNTSDDTMNVGQASLGPFPFNAPVSLSYLFYELAPAPWNRSVVLDMGDSTVHIEKAEIHPPDKNNCTGKLEWKTAAHFIPGAMSGIAQGGRTVFLSCQVKASRCMPQIAEPVSFCNVPLIW